MIGDHVPHLKSSAVITIYAYVCFFFVPTGTLVLVPCSAHATLFLSYAINPGAFKILTWEAHFPLYTFYS